MLFASMLALGAVIGFVGAGGAGVTIALLTVGFHVPIHTALGVALAAMTFTMISGTISHFRQHEVLVKTGAIIGLGGVAGACIGAQVSDQMAGPLLTNMTAIMLLSSAILLYLKVYQGDWLKRHFPVRETLLTGRKLWIYGILAAAVIQLTLMVAFGVPLLQTIGTCMRIVLPISASGGLGYLFNGHLDFAIFIQTLLGLMIGAWFGAKWTHLAPRPVLKFFIVALPTSGALSMFLNH